VGASLLGEFIHINSKIGTFSLYETMGVIGFVLGHVGTLLLGQLGLFVEQRELKKYSVTRSLLLAVVASALGIGTIWLSALRTPFASNELIVVLLLVCIVFIPALVLSAGQVVYRYKVAVR
jgi:hypothetical protein